MTKDKTCATCGRTIEWRKKWDSAWDALRYCSDRCRRHKPSALDGQLEEAILTIATTRGAGKTMCPSEAAKAVREDWRPLMERTRQAARRLVAQGRIEILQKGRVVDPSTAKGPIRLRSRPSD